jgi:hypothetical protein
MKTFSPKDLRKMKVVSIESIFNLLKDNWLIQKRMIECSNSKHRHRQLKHFAKKCMETIAQPMCYGGAKE